MNCSMGRITAMWKEYDSLWPQTFLKAFSSVIGAVHLWMDHLRWMLMPGGIRAFITFFAPWWARRSDRVFFHYRVEGRKKRKNNPWNQPSPSSASARMSSPLLGAMNLGDRRQMVFDIGHPCSTTMSLLHLWQFSTRPPIHYSSTSHWKERNCLKLQSTEARRWCNLNFETLF